MYPYVSCQQYLFTLLVYIAVLLLLLHCELACNKVIHTYRHITELQFDIKVVLNCKPSPLLVKVFTLVGYCRIGCCCEFTTTVNT
jgi:hypothetical protein